MDRGLSSRGQKLNEVFTFYHHPNWIELQSNFLPNTDVNLKNKNPIELLIWKIKWKIIDNSLSGVQLKPFCYKIGSKVKQSKLPFIIQVQTNLPGRPYVFNSGKVEITSLINKVSTYLFGADKTDTNSCLSHVLSIQGVHSI